MIPTLIVATILCLFFDPKRWLGMVGVILLFNHSPILVIATTLVCGVAFLKLRRYR